MHESLEEFFDTHRELFPPSILDKEMLRQRVQVYCTLQQTLDTRALKKEVGPSDIDAVKPWKALKQVNGNRPQQPMLQYNAELKLLLGPSFVPPRSWNQMTFGPRPPVRVGPLMQQSWTKV